MNLKSLTIHGFKSFAQRTTLEFPGGVVAVVGPNGSGKSNISDAIRWVLGEQSIRLLRGHRLEDVIFSGSDSKRAVGMAEVSLTFDNTSKVIPVDYAEVTVSRRVYRSGESEFSINRNPCRLRDIQELFMDTGLGKGSLAIIGQGEVDLLLNARPEDRRAFLEEAAGITRYRVRKAEAVQRLSQTSDDLLRLGDIIAEIERQLEPLAKDAESARTYKSLMHELQTVEALLLWERKVHLEHKREQSEAHRLTIVQEHRDHKESVSRLEQEITACETELDRLETDLEQVRKSKEEARLVQTEARHREEMAKEKVARIDREKLERGQRIQEIQNQMNDLAKELAAAKQSLNDVEVQCAEVESSVHNLHTRRQALQEQYEGHGQGIAQKQARWQQMTERVVLLKARQQSLAESEAQLAGQIEDHERAKAELEDELKTAAKEVERTEGNLEQVENQFRDSQQDHAKTEENLRTISSRQTEAQRQLNDFSRRLHDARARLKALSEMDDAREGYHRGVKAVLQAAPSRGWDLKGAVAELLNAPQELEVAIEVALGASLQFIVAQSDRDAQGAIEYLKQHRVGRATFLPLDSLKPQRAPKESVERLAEIAGSVGLAADLVDVTESLRPAVDYLLGRVAVAHNLDAALQISRRVRGLSRVVTLDGDVVVPGGAMTGGSRPGRSEGLLGRSRRLERLQFEVGEIERQIAQVQNRLNAFDKEAEQTRQRLADIDRYRRQVELIRHTAVRDLQEARMHLERVEKSIADWQKQRERLNREIERVSGEKNQNNHELDTLEEEQRRLSEDLKAREEEMGSFRREDEKIREELNSLQISLAGLVQQREHIQAEIGRLTKEEAALNQGLTEEKGRLDQLRAEQTGAHEMIGQAAVQMSEARKMLDDADQQERLLGERREKTRQTRNELGVKVKASQEKLQQIHERLTKSEVELDRISRELEAILMQLNERGIHARPEWDGESQPDVHQLERQSRSLKAHLQSIGPVNLNAIKEFEAVSERHAFLTEQREDLEEAKEKLHQVIARIDKESRAKFDALFGEVQKAFSRVFTRLFHGGKAKLELLDPDNPLESGVDIFVQPPGKRLQNLIALSGGERALAAIALLFAILSVRPSPFCVLDEIDAALDEHNLTRFRDLLKEFAATTQFLVITHRQGTMESADCLFGVTMEESGVSRLVSINLEDVKTA